MAYFAENKMNFISSFNQWPSEATQDEKKCVAQLVEVTLQKMETKFKSWKFKKVKFWFILFFAK